MKTPTSELEGAALDWAVAKAIGRPLIGAKLNTFDEDHLSKPDGYSTNWSKGGPLIESHHLIIDSDMGLVWVASAPTELQYDEPGWVTMTGPSVLIAACRAIVAAKIGPAVDVPEGLCQ